jgi:hypothetical protein
MKIKTSKTKIKEQISRVAQREVLHLLLPEKIIKFTALKVQVMPVDPRVTGYTAGKAELREMKMQGDRAWNVGACSTGQKLGLWDAFCASTAALQRRRTCSATCSLCANTAFARARENHGLPSRSWPAAEPSG